MDQFIFSVPPNSYQGVGIRSDIYGRGCVQGWKSCALPGIRMRLILGLTLGVDQLIVPKMIPGMRRSTNISPYLLLPQRTILTC